MFGFLHKHGGNEQIEWNSGYFDDSFEDFKGLDEPKLTYMMEEARIFLQSLWEAHERLVQKAAFLLGSVIALIGFVLSQTILGGTDLKSLLSLKGGLLLLYLPFLVYVAWRLSKTQFPLATAAPGTQPKDLFRKEVIDRQFMEIAVRRLELYQDSMIRNLQQNTGLVETIQHSCRVIVAYPVIAVVVYSLSLVSQTGFAPF